jgi:hypothetical protein
MRGPKGIFMTDDETPEADGSVESAAAAIEDLLKRKPEEDEPADQASPSAEKPQMAQEPDQRAGEAARRAGEAEAARAQMAQTLNHLLPQLEHTIRGEFADIKSQADIARLAQSDPARYNRLVLAQNQYQEAQRARLANAAGEQKAAQERHLSWQDGERRKVAELVPELGDPEKGPALARKLQEFAIRSGYTAQHLAMASATDCAMLHRAMQYQNLSEAQGAARAKAARAPRVAEPGTRAGAAGNDRMEADFARLKKSGATQDAAAVFRNILS